MGDRLIKFWSIDSFRRQFGSLLKGAVVFGVCLQNLVAAINQVDTLTVFPGDSALQFSRSFIIPETLILTDNQQDTILVSDCEINSMSGQLKTDLENADTLIIIANYQYLDLKLPRQQILNPPPRVYIPRTSDSETNNAEIQNRQETQIMDYDFLKSGTIYRGVSLRSNSGMALQSGLNIELQGQISEDISIVGSLTDQNIPIQPEGNTQTIEEIDKVFIQVQMPHENITFGDYEFSNRTSELSAYQRKLQGVLLESNRAANQAQLSGAITKGQYTSNYFNGEEANQGPYQLIGKEGETAIIVLAGTEKVWINGEAIQRGENNDYVIDYSTGELSFTPYRLITSDSRISVDFQYSNLVYQKNIWIARNTTSLSNGKLKLTAGMISESDDRDNPIELVLTDSDINRLKQLGDDVDNAFQSTIKEDSNGVYILSADSTLEFVGQGGTHSASFYNIGARGSYKKVYQVDGIYFEYVDKSDPITPAADITEAVYMPVKPLKLPSTQRLYHFSGQWQASKFLMLSSELAGSDFDRNTFSSINDNDNRDLAFDIKSNIRLPISKRSSADVNLKFRHIGERFEAMDRFQEVEYRRKWDLPSDSTQGEQVMEAGIGMNLNEIVIWKLDLGTYNRNEIDANRYKISGALQYKWLDRLELYQERIQRSMPIFGTSEWLRQKFLLRFNIKNIKPFTELYSEERTGATDALSNFQFVEQRYGIDLNGSRKISGRLESYFRNDHDLVNDQWQSSGTSQNYAFSGQINDWHSFYSRFSYTFRIKEYLDESATPDQQVQLMDIMLKQQPRKLPYAWETTMKIEEERTVKKEYQYYYVGKGEGQFIYDSTFSDYVPHPQGDYILRVIPSEIKEPVTSVRNGLRLQLNGRRLKGKIPWNFPTKITTLTDIRLQQQIRSEDNPLSILTIDKNNIDDRWAYFNRTFQQDLLYHFDNRQSDIRLRFLDNNTISQLDVRGREKYIARESSVRYKGNFIGKLRLESKFSSEYTYRKSDFNILRDRDIRSYQLDNTFSYLWNIVHLYELELKGSYDLDQSEDDLEALLVGVRNSYERKVKSKGRWKGFLEIDRVAVTPEGTPIPWEMSAGKREGLTVGWGVSAEYRLGKNLSLRLNYEGWNEPDRDLYHLGGGEIRALF